MIWIIAPVLCDVDKDLIALCQEGDTEPLNGGTDRHHCIFYAGMFDIGRVFRTSESASLVASECGVGDPTGL